jgi:DNA-binding transcriptional MerR regulator
LEKTTWKVGELAEKTGITIRTLHHYHEKGLLIPSGKNETGYRMYSKDDIIRLQQIISLKQFGFNLERIKQILERKDYDPVKIIQTQLNVVEEQIKIQQKLKFQLETILMVLSNQEAKTEDFIKLIGVFTMSKNDIFTKDQVEELISKSQSVPLKEKLEMVKSFNEFMANLRYCYDNELPPEDTHVKEAVEYWGKLTGSLGDTGKYESFRESNSELLKGFDFGTIGQKAKVFEYLQNAVATSRKTAGI